MQFFNYLTAYSQDLLYFLIYKRYIHVYIYIITYIIYVSILYVYILKMLLVFKLLYIYIYIIHPQCIDNDFYNKKY